MFVRPIPLMEVHVIRLFVRSAQSVCVPGTQARICISLCSGDRSVSEFNVVKPLALFSKQISEFHVAHTQETKGPTITHQFRQKLGLGRASLVPILLFSKWASRQRRTIL